jgi:chromosome partitioning protein
MGRVIAVANQKGGVGKTTSSINLAAALAAAERRTLLVDGDPQGNATSGLGIPRDSLRLTTYEALLDPSLVSSALIREVQFPFLDVLPATPDLAAAEVELVGEENRENRMRQCLEQLRGSYDFILIDCPPSLGLLTLNMLVAADSVLIPLQCEYYALEGLSQLLSTISRIQGSLNPGLQMDSVLLTMFDARLNLSRQVADDARAHFGAAVFQSVIPRNIRLAEAPSFGKPIIAYDVSSVGAQSYLAAAGEVISRYEPAPQEQLLSA